MGEVTQKLVKSKFVQTCRGANSAVIWHSLFGSPKIVSLETLIFLEGFNEETMAQMKQGHEFAEEDLLAVEELRRCCFIVPVGFDEREYAKAAVQKYGAGIAKGELVDFLGLIMSEACNFRCTYCIHFKNLETSQRVNSRKKNMRFDVAKEAVDKYLGILRVNGKKDAEINFGGGEPLLAWPVIRQVLEYCEAVYAKELCLKFSINTNASLVTREIASVLKRHHVQIASSMDGLRSGNDKVRLSSRGSGTFEQITSGFGVLENVGYPIGGIAITVTEANFNELDNSIVDWAKARGMKDLRVDVDVIGMVNIDLNEIVSKLMLIRRYAATLSIDIHGFWSRPVENLNEVTTDKHTVFCGGVRGNNMCVNPSGDIYACGYSTTTLGNIRDKQSFFGNGTAYDALVRSRFTGTNPMCHGCMIEGQCGGGCHITQEFVSATKIAKNGPMCNFYRLMTKQLLLEKLEV